MARLDDAAAQVARTENCDVCNGTGYENGALSIHCATCHGEERNLADMMFYRDSLKTTVERRIDELDAKLDVVAKLLVEIKNSV